ncbi:MAG TPA: endolytic transglycosylase MltG, partial [Peptostreptococcaceae bacterium]|nr:endolytic transglycosylase MltG [Peptostreptococcaceae bacterium]
TYLIDQSSSNKEILDLLSSGKGHDIGIKVTIPEGYTTKEIVNLLVSKNLGNKEIYDKLIKNPSEFSNEFTFLKNLKSIEGYLYPETYYFEKNLSEKEILSRMIKRFDKIYTEKFEERQKELGVDLDYIITLASIVEKEAVLDKDRPIIASVFYNRLEIDMALQSDATLQYAFPERKERVMYKDLEIESPYNSYKNKGLPPTPIACPGVKSIESTLYPDNTNYLYFVANIDKSNDYSSTYKEHLKHVEENKKERESMKNN